MKRLAIIFISSALVSLMALAQDNPQQTTPPTKPATTTAKKPATSATKKSTTGTATKPAGSVGTSTKKSTAGAGKGTGRNSAGVKPAATAAPKPGADRPT